MGCFDQSVSYIFLELENELMFNPIIRNFFFIQKLPSAIYISSMESTVQDSTRALMDLIGTLFSFLAMYPYVTYHQQSLSFLPPCPLLFQKYQIS